MKKSVSTKLAVIALTVFGLFAAVRAQSTDQSYPTPVTSNEISGTIKARDIGDGRETSFYYLIDGDQGDVFINVVTKNLDGSIDVFSADNLRPMTKITVYSDNSDGETGRVVYLRQAQKLILRIEGRTPTDDPATFRIKLAGSFKPFKASVAAEQPRAPQVKSVDDGEVRVNSVGAIIEPKPKPTPRVETENTAREDSPKPKKPTVEAAKDEPKKEPTPEKTSSDKSVAKKEPVKPADSPKKPVAVKTPKNPSPEKPANAPVRDADKPKTTEKPETEKSEPRTVKKTEPAKKKEPQPVDPSELADVRLIVLFKDGRKIERPMNEVLRFGVDRGILTIVAKDGSIGRYSILEIEKITIE